jgi:cell division protein FtsI (penicillin-binding protein 3)
VNKKRTIILNTALAFGFLVIFLRLVDLMIINHKILSEKAKEQQMTTEDIQAMRGNIYDRRARALAVNVELESMYCDSKEVAIDKERMKKLSSVLNMEPAEMQAKFEKNRSFTWLERKLHPDTVKRVKLVLGMESHDREASARGFGFIPEAKRLYPNGSLAVHVIGAVGLDNQPLEGLELKFNKYLRSAGGKVRFSRDASGNLLSSGANLESKGDDIRLTIDEGLQYIVERELDMAMSKWKAKAASVIMMDPFTGEILALANRPTYNPNDLVGTTRNEMRDRAITDVYEPGSTFKIVVGTAALEEKAVSLNSTFDCSKGYIVVGGHAVHDAHRHGVLTFREVIQKSSNVGTTMVGMRLGKDKIYKYAKRYGFGDLTGIDLPGEVSGWIRKPDRWSATSIGAVSIGQEVAVTPLQVLRAYSAVANGGYLVQPHVVSEIKTHAGETVYSFKPEPLKRVISEKTALLFKGILKTVVEEGGTAPAAAIDGNEVAGKTGTAQLIDPKTKRYSKTKYVSSFVGFVPADNPRIAVIVVIYEPKGMTYGGVVAGPVFKDIANQALSYLNVPRDDAPERNLLLVSK